MVEREPTDLSWAELCAALDVVLLWPDPLSPAALSASYLAPKS